jgi:hypothetical protein
MHPRSYMYGMNPSNRSNLSGSLVKLVRNQGEKQAGRLLHDPWRNKQIRSQRLCYNQVKLSTFNLVCSLVIWSNYNQVKLSTDNLIHFFSYMVKVYEIIITSGVDTSTYVKLKDNNV